MNKLTHIQKVAYYTLLGVWYLFSWFPFSILYLISNFFAFLLYRIIRYRRAVVRKNLTQSFPHKSLAEIVQLERAFYRYLCDYVVETIKLATISPSALQQRMRFENLEPVIADLRQRKSCSLYLGHYGNWEWISSLPMHLEAGQMCGQIYHPLQNPVVDNLFLRLRGRFGAHSIDMKNSYRTIAGWHRSHTPSIVGYIADQVPNFNSMHYWTPFLNHPDTPVFTGAERLSRMLNATIYYVNITRPRRGYYVARFVKIADEAKALPQFAITEQYIRLLEQTILRQPPYWLWSHNRWKRDRKGFNERFTEEERQQILSRL